MINTQTRIGVLASAVTLLLASGLLMSRPGEPLPVEVAAQAATIEPTTRSAVVTAEAVVATKAPDPALAPDPAAIVDAAASAAPTAIAAPMLVYPDGTTQPALNGAPDALSPSFTESVPYAPIVSTEVCGHGLTWYVHQNGARSTSYIDRNGIPLALAYMPIAAAGSTPR